MAKLLVYYSYTGNTKKIAKMIKDALDCDTIELKPKKPFSTDYNTVVDEWQNNSATGKTVEIEPIEADLNKYDEIIIGTPVWWYTMTPVVAEFLRTYDLSGKTIYPFATNAGWLGSTLKDFKKLCKNSTVKNEMNIVFDSVDLDELVTNESEILNFIEKIK